MPVHHDGDAAYRALVTTLQRLRQLLGHPEAVEFHGGQMNLNPDYVWVDCWSFERLLGRDEAALTGKALALYQGPFLAQSDSHWAIAARERLRAKLIQHLLARGRALEAEGRWEEAIACYRQGIEADEQVAAFHRKLIRCYEHLGRTAEAEAATGRLRRIAALAG
jgi:two-component SAPR family response regulator